MLTPTRVPWCEAEDILFAPYPLETKSLAWFAGFPWMTKESARVGLAETPNCLTGVMDFNRFSKRRSLVHNPTDIYTIPSTCSMHGRDLLSAEKQILGCPSLC